MKVIRPCPEFDECGAYRLFPVIGFYNHGDFDTPGDRRVRPRIDARAFAFDVYARRPASDRVRLAFRGDLNGFSFHAMGLHEPFNHKLGVSTCCECGGDKVGYGWVFLASPLNALRSLSLQG